MVTDSYCTNWFSAELQITGCNWTISDYKLVHCSTPTTYDLRPETRHRLQQSSQYDTAEVRVSPVWQNETKYGNSLNDGNCTIANRESRSFIRLNNAFRKTLLQAAKANSRKLNRPQKTTSIAR